MGVGVRHALFPGGTRLGALAFAGGVLPDATLRGMRMYRSHGGTVLTVAGRDLSSEASSPSSDAPCRERLAGRGADTPATNIRVGTITARTAPAFGRPLAPRYGSDLLPLRLLRWFAAGRPSLYETAPLRRFRGLCQIRFLPAAGNPLRASSVRRTRPFGGVGPPDSPLRSGLRSSNLNPLG